jgi:hypothetical protein
MFLSRSQAVQQQCVSAIRADEAFNFVRKDCFSVVLPDQQTVLGDQRVIGSVFPADYVHFLLTHSHSLFRTPDDLGNVPSLLGARFRVYGTHWALRHLLGPICVVPIACLTDSEKRLTEWFGAHRKVNELWKRRAERGLVRLVNIGSCPSNRFILALDTCTESETFGAVYAYSVDGCAQTMTPTWLEPSFTDYLRRYAGCVRARSEEAGELGLVGMWRAQAKDNFMIEKQT